MWLIGCQQTRLTCQPNEKFAYKSHVGGKYIGLHSKLLRISRSFQYIYIPPEELIYNFDCINASCGFLYIFAGEAVHYAALPPEVYI